MVVVEIVVFCYRRRVSDCICKTFVFWQETSATLDKVEKLIWALQDREKRKIVILLMVQKSEKTNLSCIEPL